MPRKKKLLKGFKDYLPNEMLMRRHIVETIQNVFESYGFEPIATPALEREETLLGYGEEASKQIYRFESPDGERVGLRFDLTVPLCRFIITHPDLPLPFKRYQVQPVWRHDKPDPGRFREFIQFDIDTVGSGSVVADAEIIAAMAQSLRALKIPFRIRFSNRKILNCLIKYADIPPNMAHPVFRVLDKLEKIGLERVKKQLAEGYIDDSGAFIQGLNLKTEQIEKIESFISIKGKTRKDVLKALESLFSKLEDADEGLAELHKISDVLSALGITDEEAIVDLSIARGLDYYTGPVYEAQVLGGERFGSVMGGGRYDKLIKMLGGPELPATGASVGVDRLATVIQTLKIDKSPSTVTNILITVMLPERIIQYMKLASQLRSEGFNVEVFMGATKNIAKQLKYADKKGIRFVLIMGEEEFSNKTVSVKDLHIGIAAASKIKNRQEWLKTRAGQTTLPVNNLLKWLKEQIVTCVVSSERNEEKAPLK